ncbi:MerR family transcriptional regulator [Nocardia heshunensis]
MSTNGASAEFTLERAAAFAGVSVAMVRGYQCRGLLSAPECDGHTPGRYRPAQLLRLVQIRTLEGAGVPLTEIADLLDYFSDVEALLSAG